MFLDQTIHGVAIDDIGFSTGSVEAFEGIMTSSLQWSKCGQSVHWTYTYTDTHTHMHAFTLPFPPAGIPVFAKGGNLIPLDAFESRVTSEYLMKVLGAAVIANQNMVRVW